MTKVAVTGSSGTIGSKLCDDLAKDYDVVRIDIQGVEKPVDVLDLAALQSGFAGCETVIHLARHGRGQEIGWDDMQKCLASTFNAFEAARIAGCKRVIFASSNHAVGYYEFGKPQTYEPKSGVVLGADVELRPDGLYGVWKAYGEALGRYYSDEYGLQVANLRIGNVRRDDTPYPTDLTSVAKWLGLTDEQKRKRLAAVWMSQRDLAGLVRAILASDVRYGIAYGVSDNATRFWDLEAGRALYGWWPVDGVK